MNIHISLTLFDIVYGVSYYYITEHIPFSRLTVR